MHNESENTALPALSLRKIFGLGSVYGITPVLDRALSLLFLPVFTHYLSTDKYGSLVLLYAFAGFFQLFIFMGFPDALSKIYWDYKEDERKKCLGTAWVATMLLNLAAGVPLIFFSDAIAASFFQNREVSLLFILIILRITLSTQSIIPTVIFRAREQKFHVMAINLISIFARIGFTALFLMYLRLDLLGIFLADICANVATLFVYLPALMRKITFTFRWRYLKEILSISPFQFIVGVFAWVVSFSDRLIIQHILDAPAEVGVYAVGYTFGSAIVFLVRPLLTAWFPYIYAVNSRSRQAYDSQMEKFLLYFIAVCSGAFLFISLLGPDMIRILTPGSYHRAGSLVVVVLVGQVLAEVSNYFVPTFFLAKKVQVLSYVYFVSAFINISLNYIFIPAYGIMGAAYATLAAYGVMCAMIFYKAQQIRRIDIGFRSILEVVLAATGVWALVSLVSFENPFISIAVRFGILLFCLIPLSLWFYKRKISVKGLYYESNI